jgi:hypothetical protein
MVYGDFVFCAVGVVAQPARFGGWRQLGASDSSPGGWWLGNLLRLGDSSFPLILTQGALWGIRRNGGVAA